MCEVMTDDSSSKSLLTSVTDAIPPDLQLKTQTQTNCQLDMLDTILSKKAAI